MGSGIFAKTFFFGLCVVVVSGGESYGWKKHPAGVDPNLCPNYPHCDNAILGAYAKAAGDVALAYSARAHAAPAYSAYGHGHPVPVAKGYPAWVHPKTCPNYPFCGPTPVHVPTKIWAPKYWAGANTATAYSVYGHGHSVPVAEGYPAAVNPKKCPNYPFCGPTPVHVPTKVWKPSSGHGSVVPVAKGYPSGVNPITCPNYPFCGPTPAHVPSKIWTSSNRYADAEVVAWAPSTDASYGKGPIW